MIHMKVAALKSGFCDLEHRFFAISGLFSYTHSELIQINKKFFDEFNFLI